MPFDIKPIVDTSVGGRSYNLDAGGDWSWLRQQDYAPDRAFASIGNVSRGKVLGGPTFQQFLSLDDPKKFTTIAEPPPLTTAVLDGLRNSAGGKRIGQLSLDLIDPFGTMAEATGSFAGLDQPAVGNGGSWFDPGRFLAGKGIDLFGAGDQGVPARLADYALALPTLVIAKMQGHTLTDPATGTSNSPLKYRFQQDPGYWALLDAAKSDDQIRAIAGAVAAKYIDPGRNQYLVEQLFNQMKADRDTILTGLSSGNDRIDYVAKWRFASDLAHQVAQGEANGFGAAHLRSSAVGVSTVAAELVSSIPFIGTQIAAGVAPIDAIDQAWRGLDKEQRRHYFEEAGYATAALDFSTQLPLLSGLGSAIAVAKGSTGLGYALYKTYDTTLRATSLMMGTGLVVATANWAAEAAIPGYSELLGEQIDYARPVSKSSLAGVVNELGFWSSGSFGVVPAVQVSTRAAGKAFGAAGKVAEKIHLPHVEVGDLELAFFRDGYGGSMVRNELAATGMPAALMETSIKASFLSYLTNWVEKIRRDPLEAALRGEQTPFAEVNAMNPVERQAWATDQLARGMEDGPGTAEGLIRILAYGRRKRPVIPSEDGRRAWATAAAVGRTLDEELAHDVGRTYGPDFISSRRMVGSFQAADMEAWARKKVGELGYDGTKLGKHDTEGWARIVRTLHQVEYHQLAGELAAAIEKEASAEAGKLAIIASDHVFRDEAEALIKRLESASAEEASAAIAAMISTKREAAEWFAKRYTPKAGHPKTPEAVATETFRNWLEDAVPALPTRRQNAAAGASTALEPINVLQHQLDTQGTWTLAFKPVDEAGNFVSYSRGRDGSLIKSPWVEYPITGGDNVDLGNRGYLTSKLDSLTRGFRTRRLAEFQRGQLFRIITKDADVLPEQIDAFHEGLLKLAHDRRIQTQTTGAVAKLQEFAFGSDTRKAIADLAEKVFGPGDLRGRDGKPVKMDWPAVITKAYRQSFKLNLTAGVTSYLKALGPVGAAMAVSSDIIYTAWRFGFSPLFKGGELWESLQLNAMRGTFRTDPTDAALYVHGGLGNDGSLLASELNFDQMTQALTGRGDFTPSQRLAASLSIHARHLPEDLQLQRETVATQAAAETAPFRPAFAPAQNLDAQRLLDEWGWTPQRAQRLVDNAEMVPTSLLEPLREIDRRARPEPSIHASLDALAADIQTEGFKVPIIVWWDPKTNRAVVADGNHRLTVALEQGIDQIPTVVEARPTEEILQAEAHGIVRIDAVKPGVVVPKDGVLRPSDVFAAANGDLLGLPPIADSTDGLLRQLHATLAPSPTGLVREEATLAAELDRIVGENGVVPGLEVRAKEILDRLDDIERAKGDGGPVFAIDDLSPRQQREWTARLIDSGDLRPAGADPLGPIDRTWRPTPDEVQAAFERFQRRPGNANDLADVAGTPEALFDTVLPQFAAEVAKQGGWRAQAAAGLRNFGHPTPFKQERALALQMKLMDESFPALLRASGNDGVAQVFRKLGIPEDRWARWLLEDRRLLNDWLNSGNDPTKLDALLAHAGGDAAERAAFNELYTSEAWTTITSLWAINLRATRDEAFGVHFFAPYRSAVERSINHPVLGIYPASWTIKAAREWSKFLFDNRTFGELRLGMAPAQAIASLSRAQAAAWAQDHDETLQHYLEKGPLGSTIFIFNLMMPGDWSSLPFPLSRSIREVLRGNTNPADVLAKNLDFLGMTRDAQLIAESIGELHDLAFGKPITDHKRFFTGTSVKGVDDPFSPSR